MAQVAQVRQLKNRATLKTTENIGSQDYYRDLRLNTGSGASHEAAVANLSGIARTSTNYAQCIFRLHFLLARNLP